MGARRSDGEVIEKEKEAKLIAIADNEYIARYATCENCEEKFDITDNDFKIVVGILVSHSNPFA